MRKTRKSKLQRHQSFFGAVLVGSLLSVVTGCGNHRPSVGSTGFATCIDILSPDAGPATCVNLALPDPGPNPATLTSTYCEDAESGLEFLPLPIWDMKKPMLSTVPTAQAMYFYDDNTSPFRVPGTGWEPITEPVARCGESLNDPNVHYALHLYGGPYMEWGGGLGRMLKCMNTDNASNPFYTGLDLNSYLCSGRVSTDAAHVSTKFPNGEPLAACNTTAQTPEAALMRSICPQRDKDFAATGTTDDEPYMVGMALDMSDHTTTDATGNQILMPGWEGIAFWARRSPNSQEGLRVAVADKYVDDDMSFLSYKLDPSRPRYCERNKGCNCANHKPCTPVLVDATKFDVDGNRLKYAQDPHATATRDNPCPKVVAVDENGRSLINLSGQVVTDAQRQPLKFPDGSTVTPYTNCGELDWKNQPIYGQPWQTDVRKTQTFGFCFDPSTDPVPPSGTPYELVNSRVYQQSTTAQTANALPITVPDYHACGQFFCNTGYQAGYNYVVCGENSCNLEYSSMQASDPAFHGRTCTPFFFRGGTTGSYCFDPGIDPNPSEGEGLCGDFWMKGVSLSTDWQLIKVPFASLLQQGWAKRSYQFDLSSITDVRLEWDRGWIDYWISDVRFYRTKVQ